MLTFYQIIRSNVAYLLQINTFTLLFNYFVTQPLYHVTEEANEIPRDFFALSLLNMLMEQHDESCDNVQPRTSTITFMNFRGLEQTLFWLPRVFCPLSYESRKSGSWTWQRGRNSALTCKTTTTTSATTTTTTTELKKTKLRGHSQQANYTGRETAACRRSCCQPLRVEGVAWSAQRIPTVTNNNNYNSTPQRDSVVGWGTNATSWKVAGLYPVGIIGFF
jgi:hypothetical protein